MKKKFITICIAFFSLIVITHSSSAQFNPAADANLMLTAGIGFSSWGVPVFARLEKGVADNITVGGQVSYRSRSEDFGFFGWRHTIIGISARGDYHFNELLDIPGNWDVYAGLSLGYYIVSTKDTDNSGINYTGSTGSGLGLDVQIGTRYLINDNLGVNLEFGGGNVLSGGTLGVTFLF